MFRGSWCARADSLETDHDGAAASQVVEQRESASAHPASVSVRCFAKTKRKHAQFLRVRPENTCRLTSGRKNG
eukprot:3529908-Rhodomonas_salina.1